MHMVWSWGLSTDVFGTYICYDFRDFFYEFLNFFEN